MAATNVNLGCGPVFVDSPVWINLDFRAPSPAVRQANLLGRLPLKSDTAQLVYASHFLEHIPKPEVDTFLRECLRVLQPGGVLRLVLPDLEEMARSHLTLRSAGEHERADFLVLEMIDQCVRRDTGGELGRLYRRLRDASANRSEMGDFIRERTGENRVDNGSGNEVAGGGDYPIQEKSFKAHVIACNELGCGFGWRDCRWPSAREMSVSRVSARATTGFGPSISCNRRSKRLALPRWKVRPLIPGLSRISPSSRSTWTPEVDRAMVPSRCAWRRANSADGGTNFALLGRAQ